MTKEQVVKLYRGILPKNEIIGDIPVRDIFIGDVLERLSPLWTDDNLVKIPVLWRNAGGTHKSLQDIEEWEDLLQGSPRRGCIGTRSVKQLTKDCLPLFQFLYDLFCKDE